MKVTLEQYAYFLSVCSGRSFKEMKRQIYRRHGYRRLYTIDDELWAASVDAPVVQPPAALEELALAA